ncbi:MarR family transcriptional regulator [Planctomonas sp. JC2975]|nr:MarR family transcriptional regulator [Planctomonas sp. JC2975]
MLTGTAELAESIRALSGRLARRLREQSTVGDYTPSQKNVMVRLDREGSATLSALARAEGMKPQSMASILTTLAEASMVSSQPDPNDKRQHLWALTDQAREALLAGRAARIDWLARSIRDSLDAAEEAELRRGIELLAGVVDGRTG